MSNPKINIKSQSDAVLRLGHIALDLVNSPILQVRPGDRVRALMDYNFESGVVVSVGPKNLKIHFHDCDGVVAKEKCATLTESVAVVWEVWRGGNGRGGYRLERSMFASDRVPAVQVGRQSVGEGRLTEDSFGVLRPSRNIKASP